MTGLRVIELATVIAVPVVGRMFAELGAEVIKVESDGNGDQWRSMFLDYQQDGADTSEGLSRRWSSVFEVANLSKASLQINYNTPEGKITTTKQNKTDTSSSNCQTVLH